MAHFACKQFVPFFGLLAIRHIQKDSGHLTVVDSAVIAHPSRRNPADFLSNIYP